MTRRRARIFERSLQNVEFASVRPRCENCESRNFTITAASDDSGGGLSFVFSGIKPNLKSLFVRVSLIVCIRDLTPARDLSCIL